MHRLPLVLVILLGGAVAHAGAHPAPYSFIDVQVDGGRLRGSVVLHVYDVAHDLKFPDAERLLDHEARAALRPALVSLLETRLSIRAGDDRVPLAWADELEAAPERHGVRLAFTGEARDPGRLSIAALLFPYDTQHQTFVNVHESGVLRHQAILDAGQPSVEYFAGSASGRRAVLATFVPAGVHHILIGPDHVLFLVALVILGGSVRRLLAIVTAFTVGHSVTLALAATGSLTPPASVVEPAIALSIIVVGVDNLIVRRPGAARDLRPWVALAFGLVHGFGFASVLREFGLPASALGWSLFSFNLGVELGQVAIVAVVAGLVQAVRRISVPLAEQVTIAASVVVIAAGTWWFAERVLAS